MQMPTPAIGRGVQSALTHARIVDPVDSLSAET
jgi:hypothetical protein